MPVGPSYCSWLQSQLANITVATCHAPAEAIADSANNRETRDRVLKDSKSDPRGKRISQGGIWEFDSCNRVQIMLIEQREHQYVGKELLQTQKCSPIKSVPH